MLVSRVPPGSIHPLIAFALQRWIAQLALIPFAFEFACPNRVVAISQVGVLPLRRLRSPVADAFLTSRYTLHLSLLRISWSAAICPIAVLLRLCRRA